MATQAYVFRAALVGFRGVSRTVAVRGDQTLVDLHGILQEAFEWDDDHLYSFWLTGEFWGHEGEYTAPFEADGTPAADVALDRLELEVGRKIAYVFDFGDEWRVQLTLGEIVPAEEGSYPCILASTGTAPPQYGLEDEAELEDVPEPRLS